MAKKQKEQIVTVPYAEILGMAINSLGTKWENELTKIKEIEAANPELAQRLRESWPWKPKLKIMLQMYKIETGSEYGYNYNLD